MAIDMRQFHQTFFEESLEGTAAMEMELLRLEQAISSPRGTMPDAESLNRLFRAAHSIKGGSATFGFSAVAEFSHELETVLDDLRGGRKDFDAATLNLLLRAVDCLRALVQAARLDEPVDAVAMTAITAALRGVTSVSKNAGAPDAAVRVASDGTGRGWQIRFCPHPGSFERGNDPALILRGLAELGPMDVRARLADMPTWNEFDPEVCYLGWDLELHSAVARPAVEELFAWVIEDCDLEVVPLSAVPVSEPTDPATTSIRVATDKVDALVDIVGELVITQTMLNQAANECTEASLPRLKAGLAALERNMRELQECVLGIRMLPIGSVFNRLPRVVRDVSLQLEKKIDLHVSGERTELDKAIIERISDPLMHLIRNSVDHGIETPAQRVAAGKPEAGAIKLNAYHKGGSVVIEVEDDGRGLDRQKILAKAKQLDVALGADSESSRIEELIFLPGFSTASSVTDVSGRGVGLDVVRNNIRSLGGGVEVASTAGRGTRFTIRLPLTLAIVDGMSVRVGTQTYILPLVWIAESLRVRADQVSRPAGRHEVFALRKEYLPLLRLHELFQVPAATTDFNDGIMVIVEADGKKAGLFVDELTGQQQVVIKSLETHCYKLDGISAATILGDGTVALILDVAALIRRAHQRQLGAGTDPRAFFGANQSATAESAMRN